MDLSSTISIPLLRLYPQHALRSKLSVPTSRAGHKGGIFGSPLAPLTSGPHGLCLHPDEYLDTGSCVTSSRWQGSRGGAMAAQSRLGDENGTVRPDSHRTTANYQSTRPAQKLGVLIRRHIWTQGSYARVLRYFLTTGRRTAVPGAHRDAGSATLQLIGDGWSRLCLSQDTR